MSFPSRDNVKPKLFRGHSSAAKNHEFRLIWIKHSAIIETLVANPLQIGINTFYNTSSRRSGHDDYRSLVSSAEHAVKQF